MTIGALRKRITIQRETQTPDGAGGYAIGWTDVATVWAEIRPVAGREISFAGHLEGRITHRVTLRYMSAITTDMRMTCNSRIFNIHAVLNPGERNRWTEMLVEEGGAI